jgi:hypothetical protein
VNPTIISKTHYNLKHKLLTVHTEKFQFHTCERDLVVGLVVAEVVFRRVGNAPPEVKHLVARANGTPFDPLCTTGCCCVMEESRFIYRQLKENFENQNTRLIRTV